MLVLLAACSTPERRVARNKALFETFPPAAQERIRQGEVDVGFTTDMVLIALGKPTRKFTRRTAELEQEVWSYGSSGYRGPTFGLGIGVGGGHYRGGSVYSGGVNIDTGPGREWYPDEHARVVFEKGAVVSVEKREEP